MPRGGELEAGSKDELETVALVVPAALVALWISAHVLTVVAVAAAGALQSVSVRPCDRL